MTRRRAWKGADWMSGQQPGNGVDARGGPPLLSRPWREGGEGCFPVTPPLPLFPPRRPAREAATLWPAAGDPLRHVKATEGEGGRGRGGEHKLPSMTVDGGKMNFPLQLIGQGSIDPGPLTRVNRP
ncbi:hypothetical protein Sjap_017218 [Stephania japonica]|uniref:Uncharacterized protein n=1 Tax=Stephania japonica TaxID=461633 RepID=A0AAP0I5U8_9MAGN